MIAARFTPTCVGQTAFAFAISISATVHPHVRGADNAPTQRSTRNTGSPPRAWGRPGRRLNHGAHHRFTPTCVGQTWPSSCPARGQSVHPHVRGADIRATVGIASAAGSPPRAWGRREVGEVRRARPRFTPTCVGQTAPGSTHTTLKTVHPHVRGADRGGRFCCGDFCGSPPRAWGRPFLQGGFANAERFTPTCVGQTGRARRADRG